MPTRIDRLKQGRKRLKPPPQYTILDIAAGHEILGIDIGGWIYDSIANSLPSGGLAAAMQRAAKSLRLPPHTRIYSEYKLAKEVVKKCKSLDDLCTAASASLTKEQLQVKSIYCNSKSVGENNVYYTDADVEALLRDFKLLFRAEHVALLLNALRPWESFLGMYSECFELASNNMNSVIMDAQKNADELKNATKLVVGTVIAAGFTALALTGVGLIPAIAAAAVAESATCWTKLGVETVNKYTEGGVGLFVEGGKENSWLNRKLDQWFKRPNESNIKDFDVKTFRAKMISVISAIREFAFSIVDVTTDINFYMLLDYVHYQAKSGRRVGLETSGTNAGKQQDDTSVKDGRDLGGIELVRKSRNMLEKAFEFWFAQLMEKLQFPEELKKIRADKEEAFSIMSKRVELDLWKNWVPTNESTTKTPENIRMHITHLAESTLELVIGPMNYISAACPDYATWLALLAKLPHSQTSWQRMMGTPGTRDYPKDEDFKKWLSQPQTWNPLTLLPKVPPKDPLTLHPKVPPKDFKSRPASVGRTTSKRGVQSTGQTQSETFDQFKKRKNLQGKKENGKT